MEAPFPSYLLPQFPGKDPIVQSFSQKSSSVPRFRLFSLRLRRPFFPSPSPFADHLPTPLSGKSFALRTEKKSLPYESLVITRSFRSSSRRLADTPPFLARFKWRVYYSLFPLLEKNFFPQLPGPLRFGIFFFPRKRAVQAVRPPFLSPLFFLFSYSDQNL